MLFLIGLLAMLIIAPQASAAGPPVDDGQSFISFVEIPDAVAVVDDAGVVFADGFIVDKTILLADEPVAFIRMTNVFAYRADAIWLIEPGSEPLEQSWQSDEAYNLKLLLRSKHRLYDNPQHIDPGLIT